MARLHSAAALLCIAFAATPSAAQPPAAQGPNVPRAQTAEMVKRLLVSPGEWLMNWPDTTLQNITGNATLTFEARDGALIVRIHNILRNIGCEKPVVIAGDRVSFDGCIERGLSFRFTPDDAVFAFRGESALRWYTIRPY